MTIRKNTLAKSSDVPQQDGGLAVVLPSERRPVVFEVSSRAASLESGLAVEGDSDDEPTRRWYTTDVRGNSFWYLSRFGTTVFDNQFSVNAILFGNAQRMIRMALDEVEPGTHVMQPAAVYGSFSRQLAQKVGPAGKLEITDIAPIQVNLTRRKMADFPFVSVDRLDAQTPNRGPYDAVTLFMLLHEIPRKMKKNVMAACLSSLKVGGRLVVVDYGRPVLWHPLNMLMKAVFTVLEPFAEEVWREEVWDWAPETMRDRFIWSKTSIFGDMYQKVVATRIS